MPDVPVRMPKMSMTMTEGELLSWHVAQGDVVRAGQVVAEVLTDKVDMEVECPVDGSVSKIDVEEGSTVDVGTPLAWISSESVDLLEGLFDDISDSAHETNSTPSLDINDEGLKNEAVESTRLAQAEGQITRVTMQQADASSDAGAASDIEAPRARGDMQWIEDSPKDETASEVAQSQAPQRQPSARDGSPSPALPGARRRAAELGLDPASVSGSGPNGVVRVADVEDAARLSLDPPSCLRRVPLWDSAGDSGG